jgi:4-hydroxy-tetrahydrodipicolinate reductase
MAFSILLHGARGRMGVAVTAAAGPAGVTVVPYDRAHPLAAALDGVDAVVDFSAAAATSGLLAAAVAGAKPIVVGTTGHTAAEQRELQSIAAQVPCVWAGNFSVGVNLLYALTRLASRTLGEAYDTEVVEMHHRLKKDAPSGTAVRLLEIVLAERRLGREALRNGREGMVGARPAGEVGVHALRGGDVIGDHTLHFAGPGERLELTHRATDRAVFAQGALRAARWVVDQPPGLYDMQDVLGLKGLGP